MVTKKDRTFGIPVSKALTVPRTNEQHRKVKSRVIADKRIAKDKS